MKSIQVPVVEVISLCANDILTTSLQVGDPITPGNSVTGNVSAREGVFDAPAAPAGNGIWQ